MARLTLFEKAVRDGHLDAYIEGDERPLWKEIRAGVGYSTRNKRGGSRRFGLTYHSDDDAIGGAAEWRWRKGGLARNGRTKTKHF